MRVLSGMSGFAYKEWKGSFYPADLPAEGMLAHYASRFPTVEINSTFYRMPKEDVLLDWARRVPAEFTFCLKASRRITHDARLDGVEDLLEYVLRTASVLDQRRGPMLFQLPPFQRKDLARLRDFLALLPRGWRTVMEWRHSSWFDDEVYALLRDHGVALCVAEQEEGATPMVPTAPWGYVRLHRSGYTDADLAAWAARIREQPWDEVFVFFKHEEDIAGPAVAQRFADLAG